MDRRRFLQAGGALVAGGLLADLDFFESAASAAARSQARPNIVFILVDEMRFPTEFPAGVQISGAVPAPLHAQPVSSCGATA